MLFNINRMRDFSDYKQRKICAFYLECNSVWETVKRFWLTYKEMYKLLDNSRRLSFRYYDWVKYKICNSCKSEKIYNDTFFYKRNWTELLYTSCKDCMNQLSRTYNLINKQKRKAYNNEKVKKHYYNNQNKILRSKAWYYNTHRRKLLQSKRLQYKESKKNFMKNILYLLK